VPIGDHTRAIPPANPSLALAFPVIAYAPAHAIALDASVCSNDVWTVDCGATRHFVGSEKELTRVTDTAPRVTVQVASGTMSSATNEGDIVRTAETPDGPVTVTLTGVLVVPGFVHNLLSCCYAFEHDGIRTELNDARRLVLPSGRDVPFLDDQHRYLVSLATPSGGGDAAPAQACTTDLATPPDEIIHARLAHFGISRLRKAVGKIKGINLSAFKGHEDCEHCAKGGFRSARFTKQTRQNPPTFAYFGECVTSDLAGPFPPSTPSHFQYAIIFFDRYSKYISVYYMQTKRSEEVKACLEQFISDHRSWLKNGGVTEWFTDNGGEFRSKDLDAFCHELAIKRGFSVPYKSNTNHTAERAWGILLRPTRIIANSQEGVSKWWPFIMEQVRLVHIALPTGTDEAPLLKARPNSSQPPDLSMFRVMLCRCIARISKVPDHMKDTAHKLSPLGYECAYLGFDPSRKAHRVYALHLNLITYVVDKETKFYENEFPHWKDEGDHAITFKYIDSNELPAPDSTLRYQPDVQPQPRARPTPVATPPPHQAEAIPWGDSTQPNIDLLATQMFSPPPENANVVQLDKDLVHLDTSTKVGVASSDLTGEVALVSLTDTEPIPIPKTYKEAVEGPWADKWLDAMKEDLEGKARNNMSKKVPHDGKRPLMKGKWVYTIKYNPDGSIKKFKARWVAKGYSQIEGLHYNETFSSTMRAASTRLLLASSVGIDDFTNKPKQRKHVDVDKAFTHSDIDCDIEMEQPHGFAVPGMADLLLKALEGTKQGGHLWQELSSTKMRNFGMTQSTIDPNLFYKKEGNEWIRVGVFVDDILAVFNTTAIFTRFLNHYKNTEPKITCHDEGEVNQFTGSRLPHQKTISLSQSANPDTSKTCTNNTVQEKT
jgi:transposase InsO family protein